MLYGDSYCRRMVHMLDRSNKKKSLACRRLQLIGLVVGVLGVCASVRACPVGDLNGDCKVDWRDLELFAGQWLDAGCAGAGCADFDGTAAVSFGDFAYLAASWLDESHEITVVINEFMASNTGSFVDEHGDSEDWIELYNYGAWPVDVGGLYLADRIGTGSLWRIPGNVPATTIIQPGGFLVIWADDEIGEGPLHASFKLAAGGEQIGLYDSGQMLLDSVFFGPQGADHSYGRYPDGDDWRVFETPTPGASNQLEAPNIIISELMYHPGHEANAPEPADLEYIELYNAGAEAVDMTGWRFADGVEFTFGEMEIAAGAYLIVAADVNAFEARYPEVANVTGGWSGRLSNSGEMVELVDGAGVRMDFVEYADQGDWAVRRLGPEDYGHRGWMWSDDHDGRGKSLELVNPAMPNEYAHNWGVSDSNDGTPGVPNPNGSSDVAPLIANVGHYPVVPGPNDSVTVTAEIRDEVPAGVLARLYYRADESEYTDSDVYAYYDANSYMSVAMYDDGAHGDGASGDGVYGGVIPPHADGQIIEFFIEAVDGQAQGRTWPAPSVVDGIAEQVTNALYQVDGSFDHDVYWDPESQPIYYLVMTQAEKDRLLDIGDREGGEYNSNAQMNATFISVDGVDIKVRYNAGIRNRGHGSRNDPPNNYRVNFVHGRPWKGVTAINLNTKFTYLQKAGNALFALAGVPQPVVNAVQVRVNGENLAVASTEMYGSYAHAEVVDGDFAEHHFPDDDGGNAYKCMRDAGPADFRYLGDDSEAYALSYLKQTNEAQRDWSDIIDLCYVMSNVPDSNFVKALNRVINVEQWLKVLAINALLDNNETSIANGYGDDYFLYRGIKDPRFILIQHDLDSIFGFNGSNPTRGIFRATGMPAMKRFLEHPQITPRYYYHLRNQLETTFSAEQLEPALDQLLGDFVPNTVIRQMLDFMEVRRPHVLSLVPDELVVDTDELVVMDANVFLTDVNVIHLSGWADAVETRSVLVGGKSATWGPLDGAWTTRQASDVQSDILISRGAKWKYFDQYTDLGPDWYVSIDDALWPSGRAELGYGDDGNNRPEVTTIGYADTDPCGVGEQRNITTYFTRSFDMNDVSKYARLSLRILRDDGAVVYLNGVEIARSNMDDGAVGFNTPAASNVAGAAAETAYYGGAVLSDDDDFTNIDAGLLYEGVNRIAVEIHQYRPSSPDISFDLELRGILRQEPAAGGVVLNPGYNRILIETLDGPAGSGDVLEQTSVDVYYEDGDVAEIAGTIAGHVVLDAASGPWRVTSDVIVVDGGLLEIQAGTTVLFADGTGLTVGQGGRLLAEGTRYRHIRMTRMIESEGTWSGILLDGTQQDNRLRWVDIEYADNSHGTLDIQHAKIRVESVTWAHTNSAILNADHPSATIENAVFPSITNAEPVHGVGLSGDEYLVFRGCTFGGTSGYNDIIDFTDCQRPGPIIEFYDNVFLGGGDDGPDLDGADAHIEGNVFANFRQDHTGSSTSNIIATGRGGGNPSQVVAVRNIFMNSDHGILLTEDSFLTAQNNLFVGMDTAAISFGEPDRGRDPGRGAMLEGNIFWNNGGEFQHFFEEPNPQYGPQELSVYRNVIPSIWHEYGAGNVDAAPVFVDPNGDYRLISGSAGKMAGAWGLDMGPFVRSGAAISGEPAPVTWRTDATLTVGGPGITHYRYSVNGASGPWSPQWPVDKPIELAGLTDGESYTVYAIGRNSAGRWQREDDAKASRTWKVDASYRRLRINEILAHTHEGQADMIELYYDGAAPLDLTGMSLTDDPGDRTRFVFHRYTVTDPVMTAGSYMVLYADTATQGKDHVGFALSGAGEGLYLYDKPSNGGLLLDSVTFGPQINDYSIGRTGFDGRWKLTEPTFGAANIVQPLGDARDLKINEWFTNGDILLENDFIEIHNPSSLPVDLSALSLTDDPVGRPDRCTLGPLSFVEANGYAVFVADGGTESGHLSFKLSSNSGLIGLFDADSAEVDQVIYGPQTTDVAYGRTPDGQDSFAFFELPTPGAANGAALDATVTEITLSPEFADKRAIVPVSADAVGADWLSDPEFDDVGWLLCQGAPGGVGYERSFGYGDMISLDVEAQMYGDNASCYVRIPFVVDANDLADMIELVLAVRYDDGFVAYLNGVEIARRNFGGIPRWDSDADGGHEAGAGNFDEYIDVSAYIDVLQTGENLLAIHAMNSTPNSSDFLVSAELKASRVETNSQEYPHLQSLELLHGLRITEIMYNAQAGSSYDYIEFSNVGDVPLDVNGVRVSGGIDFVFGSDVLEPGQCIVAVRDASAFRSEYGSVPSIAGEYAGNLSNGGEQLVLLLPVPLDVAILRFEYSDQWHPSTDGGGRSLVIRNGLFQRSAWRFEESWQAELPSPGDY